MYLKMAGLGTWRGGGGWEEVRTNQLSARPPVFPLQWCKSTFTAGPGKSQSRAALKFKETVAQDFYT
jgi:hypothetical protein